MEFLEELIQVLDTDILEWLQIRIGRILAARNTEIVIRKSIIRKR
jgi:hypothetical protein